MPQANVKFTNEADKNGCRSAPVHTALLNKQAGIHLQPLLHTLDDVSTRRSRAQAATHLVNSNF